MNGTRAIRMASVMLTLAVAATAAAQCPPNEVGGPNLLVMRAAPGLSDLDFGRLHSLQNFPAAARARVALCLDGCDATMRPTCQAGGGAMTYAGVPLGPPLPALVGSLAACLVMRFADAPAGTVDLATGAVDLGMRLDGGVYLTPLASAPAGLCPRCTGAGVGQAGTCRGGESDGGPCTVDDILVVAALGTANAVYPVSADCLPAGAPAAVVPLDLRVTTGRSSIGNPCAARQARGDDCVAGPCDGPCASAASQGGIADTCCADDATRACLPDPVVRTGRAVLPVPAWPDPAYPKHGDGILVSTFCAGTERVTIVDAGIGLPGPVALTRPVSADWLYVDDQPPATTTTTVPPRSLPPIPPEPPLVCATPRCTVDGVLASAACAGDRVPAGIVAALARATALVARAGTRPPARTTHLRGRARAVLTAAIRRVARAARGRRPRLSPGCAAALVDAAARLRAAIP
jgi:hypothetical protein